jgi:uncharacterized protein
LESIPITPPQREWIDTVEDRIVFCRVTQMGLLRLLTNRHVMGLDALLPARAWSIFDAFLTDSRISMFSEPRGLEHYWRNSTIRQKDGSNWWTDTTSPRSHQRPASPSSPSTPN